MTERLPRTQEVNEGKSRQKRSLRTAADSPRPARVQFSPFKRKVLKGERPEAYPRIVETLKALANQHGVADAPLQRVLSAVLEQFPAYPRPSCGCIWKSVILGAAAGEFQRIASGPDRVIVRFPRKAERS